MNTETRSQNKRVLFVAYLFPPTGGVGVLRAAKFVKYLPKYGWDVTVLTAENPSVPLTDESLLKQIPSQTVIRTARTYEPDYSVKARVANGTGGTGGLATRFMQHFKRIVRSAANVILQPDAGILWYPRAIREGMRILKEQSFDAIMVTAPPFSSLLVGAALARRSGVPLVVDYRDEWTINKAYLENAQGDRFTNWIQRKLQNRVLRTAHTIVATTPRSAAALETTARDAGSQAVGRHIYNGFDPDDFPDDHDSLQRTDYGNGIDRLRIAFVGTLWKLTSIEPFLLALEIVAELRPALLDQLEIVVAGRQVGDEVEHLNQLKSLRGCHVVDAGFLDHDEALRLMATSDWLLQLLSDLPSVERVIASKLFEYMGAGRPILAITGRGDHWDIVSSLPQARVHHPDEISGIAESLIDRLQSHMMGVKSESVDFDVSRFERRELTRELATILDGLSAIGDPETSAETGSARDRQTIDTALAAEVIP